MTVDTDMRSMLTDVLNANVQLLQKLSTDDVATKTPSKKPTSTLPNGTTPEMVSPFIIPADGTPPPQLLTNTPATSQPVPTPTAQTRWTETRYNLTLDDCADVLTRDALTLLRAEDGLSSEESQSQELLQMASFLQRKERATLPQRLAKQKRTFECGVRDPPLPTLASSQASLKVGGFLDDQKVYFWADDSTVSFYVDPAAFPTQESFSATERAFEITALAWTRVAPGDTQFVRVYSRNEANYQVVYGGQGPRPGTLASASPPALYTRGENSIIVYARAFQGDSLPIMANIMVHEFGHVVGLRHSFAQDSEAVYESGSFYDDPSSVMSYNFPPLINLNDVRNTREIYNICEDGKSYYFRFQGQWLLFEHVRVSP